MSAIMDANVFGCHFPETFATPELSVAPMKSAPHLFKDYFAVAAMRPTAFVFYSRINDFAGGCGCLFSTGRKNITHSPAFFFAERRSISTGRNACRSAYYFAETRRENPPVSPFKKGEYRTSPFGKGGLRGISKNHFAGGPEVCLYGECITTGPAGLLFFADGHERRTSTGRQYASPVRIFFGGRTSRPFNYRGRTRLSIIGVYPREGGEGEKHRRVPPPYFLIGEIL